MHLLRRLAAALERYRGYELPLPWSRQTGLKSVGTDERLESPRVQKRDALKETRIAAPITEFQSRAELRIDLVESVV